MNSIETMFHKMIPDKYYEVQKHNLVGIFFVVLVILIAQYPADFRRSFNTVYGKLFILILIMLLTNYNVVAGLTATIVVLALYIDLFKTGNEGFAPKGRTEEESDLYANQGIQDRMIPFAGANPEVDIEKTDLHQRRNQDVNPQYRFLNDHVRAVVE